MLQKEEALKVSKGPGMAHSFAPSVSGAEVDESL